MKRHWSFLIAALMAAVFSSPSLLRAGASQDIRPTLEKGNHVVLIGNTLAERMLYHGYFETEVYTRFPELDLVIRNLGWSADELTLRPRSKDFNDHGHTLKDHQPDLVIAFFGFNESFKGKDGLPKFKKDLENFVKETTSTSYNGKNPPQLALISPIANENLPERSLTAGDDNNGNLELYTEAMKEVAAAHQVAFVDLFRPTLKLYETHNEPLTINGVHLNEKGYQLLAPILDEALFGSRSVANPKLEKPAVLAAVQEKNLQFFYDYRAVNGYYIYGGRKEPFGVVNFPVEFAKLRKMIENRDQRIWKLAKGESVPAEIDDSNTGPLPVITTNINHQVKITTPEEAIKHFQLPEGFEINLYASEVDFPDLENPVQFAFDAQGRLYVATMPSYPMYEPGTPVDDKVLIFEDQDGDGKADKQTIFARGLHVPTGIELDHDGAYVAQQPNLVFLKDLDGDDQADESQIRLHGFDSADSHHSISAFTWGPGGGLYFQEGTFHHSQVETPYGPVRLVNAGVFRYEPMTERFDVFVSYSFANPWGHIFDRWGQNFVADASGGANYYGTAFSGDLDYPHKHRGMNQFLNKQWRPTAGCEIVSSRNFPEAMQGNFLLNNCIGFQGILQYKFRDDGSGFFADPVEPLLKSSDPNFRPVDIEFGPDGALYIVDWFNPLIGHMQHSLRDPNRDKKHGRIWRITYKGNPLVQPAKIEGQPIPALLDLLKSYEARTRYRVRTELRGFPTKAVKHELNQWLTGLDPADENYEHHRLEALWVLQHHHIVDEAFLKELLRSKDHRVRAAATRVLCYWRHDLEEPLALLQVQVNDDHPRVRLEAIRALSFFDSEEAKNIAYESLAYDQDYYLEYTLKETLDTLDRRIAAKKN